MHDPKVLLLDEPAGNLDPRARIEMRELLKELRRMGKTILISSHILPELQDLCNTVGIIEQGELLYAGPWTDIVKRAKTGIVLHVDGRRQPGTGRRAAQPGSQHRRRHPQQRLSWKSRSRTASNDYSFVPQRLVQGGFKLTMLKEEEVNLETAFMRLTKGMVQ